MRIFDWKIGKLLEYALYLCVFVVLAFVIIYKMLNAPQILPQGEDYPVTEAEIIERVQVLDSIPVDTIVSIKYQIVNIGHDSLRIVYVNPDCTCTDFTVSSSIIPPKDTTDITLMYNSKESLGENKINAIIKLNTKRRIYKITAYINVIER